MIKKLGFTLAEVLITIGIIGVIAAVTLPALNSNVSNAALEKQTQKFYTQLSRAFDLYKVDNEIDSITAMDFDANAFVKKYFNIIGKCENADDCYAPQYTYMGSNELIRGIQWFNKNSTYVLADGTVFTIENYTESTPVNVTFDVNGKKGPNKVGRDLWAVSVYYDGSVDEGGITPEIRKGYSDTLKQAVASEFKRCKTNSCGGGCFGHFMRNNFKFDY